MNRSFIFLFTVIFFLGCNNNKTAKPIASAGINKFVYPDENGKIMAQIGDTVEIKILNTASDGGYWWNITANSDSTIAPLINFRTESSDTTSKLDGTPTYEIWHFLATKNGTDTLKLVLNRKWEPQKIIETKYFYLTVQ
jgi:predicted secreted protein